MNEPSYLGLIHNAALLLTIALFFDIINSRWRTGNARLWQVLIGFLLGGIGIVLMLTPWVYTPGIIFDTRSVLLGISGLFFGPLPTLIAMSMTAAFRLYQGGTGTLMGETVILVTGLIGIAWRYYRQRPLVDISWRELYLFGLVIHIAMLGLMISLPWDTALQVFTTISLQVLVIYPLGTTLLGRLLVNRLRRDQAGVALRESEERLRLAVDSANIGFFDRNLQTNRVHFSPEWKKQIGYQGDEISDDSKEWESRVHPDDLEVTLARVNACIQGLSPTYESEYRLRHKDGSYRWILARGILELDTNGQAARLMGCHIDITRQKKNEEAISASERRFRRLSESSQDYIMLYDRECRHVYENPAALQVSGLKEADIIGKTHREAGFSEELSAMWEADIQQVFTGKSSTQRFFEWESARGKVFLDWHLSPVFGSDGEVELVLGISHDITALKQAEKALRESEEKFRRIFETSGIGISLANLHGEFLDGNPAILKLLGYAAEEYCRISISDISHPDDAAKDLALYQELLGGKRESYTIEKRNRHKNGRFVWGQLTCTVVRDSDGKPLYTIGMFEDISERKQAEEDVQAVQVELQQLLAAADQSRQALLSVAEDQKQAEEQIRQLNTQLEQRVHDRTAQLEAANQELEAFSYSVSHDLRAPLRALDGFSTALLEDYPNQLDEQGRDYLSRIQEAARRMGQLINDLLNLSRVTRTEFSRQRVDLSALAFEIAAELQAQNPDRQVELDISPDLVVEGDAHLLKIVLENLLNNAYKFTNHRIVSRIAVGMFEQSSERVYYVRDNGAGFDMTYAGKLFAPFQRLHGMREFPGTGIGLVTVQRIITRHGGRIWPEAAVDQGATFYFTLGKAG